MMTKQQIKNMIKKMDDEYNNVYEDFSSIRHLQNDTTTHDKKMMDRMDAALTLKHSMMSYLDTF